MENYYISLVILSFVVAVLGSLMALLLTRDALKRPETDRNGLIILAALCLGGVGIWSMHFIGMLAFNMAGLAMNYNWGLTVVSLIVAVGAVYIGLRIMSLGEFKISKLILSGILVATGVVGMHYTGMFAMEMQADVAWSSTIIIISIVIAVVASIVALWLATHVSKMWQVLVSAVVMGVAVCGMHYTGMAAAEFVHNTALAEIEPMAASSDLFSLGIAGIDTLILIVGMMSTMVEANRRRTS